MNEISNLFNNLVFPTAMCVIFIVFIYKKIWPRIEKTLDRVTETCVYSKNEYGQRIVDSLTN